MDRKDFNQLLSQRKIPSVLLFEGEEEHLKQTALKALSDRLLPEGLEDLNRTVLEGAETDQIIAAAETLPFMADRRLVIVRDHPALIARSEADERLLEYLPSVPASSVLLFYCTHKPDARKKLYSAVKKLNGTVVFSPLRDRELTLFVTSAFHDLGKECDERTADFLIFTCGSDTSLLLTEIAKVASHSGDAPAIRADSVRAVATPSTECTVFQMVDAVVSGQSSRAFLLMRNQLLVGAEPLYMLSMLLRQFRLLQHIRIMQYEKRSVSEIRSALGIPSFAADQYIRQAAGWSNGQVKSAVSICFDTEYAVKSGRLNQDGALEAVVLKLLNLRTSG